MARHSILSGGLTMNSETIYTVLLDAEYAVEGREYPLFGFSYQLQREESGRVTLTEHGHPTKVVLWESDGPQLEDLDDTTVKARIQEVLS